MASSAVSLSSSCAARAFSGQRAVAQRPGESCRSAALLGRANLRPSQLSRSSFVQKSNVAMPFVRPSRPVTQPEEAESGAAAQPGVVRSMLSPRRVKHRKQHRGRLTGKASRGNTIAFGSFALQAQEPTWITARQIESGRRAMTRYARRGGKIWIRVFPDKPITMRPAETRMGSGKGSLSHWVAVVKPGRILYEMAGVSPQVARAAMAIAAQKMPIKVKFITKEA